MLLNHQATVFLASFAASLVESAEALTIVLAVGVSRNWRSAITGAASGLAILVIFGIIFGPALGRAAFPLFALKIVIGVILLVFGLRWLRKAVLRTAGRLPMHDEAKIFQNQMNRMGAAPPLDKKMDATAFATSFKSVFLEGIEVIFIVLAIGSPLGSELSAVYGALLALLVVVALGLALHRPLTRIPENILKFGVAVILTSFGILWLSEGCGFTWTVGDLVLSDWALPLLMLIILGSALLTARSLRRQKTPS